MLGKRSRGLQRSTSTSHVIEMAAATTDSSCPPKERARPPAVAIPRYYHILPKDIGNNDIQSDKLAASPRSPLWALQCLLTNYFTRKAEGAGEPKTSVGLSIVIENLSNANNNNIMSPCVSKMQILNKSMQVAAQCKDYGLCKQKKAAASSVPVVYSDHALLSPLPVIDFLDACYLCKRSLGPGRDIYMYRGDRAFCSVECRWQQILTDEQNEKCSSAAIKPVTASPSRRSGGHGHGHGHVRNRYPPLFSFALALALALAFVVTAFASTASANSALVFGVVKCEECPQKHLTYRGALVGIECRSSAGDVVKRGVGSIEENGEFRVSIPLFNEKEECHARLLSRYSKAPCSSSSTHGHVSSKLIFKDNLDVGEQNILATSTDMSLSSRSCPAAFLWPYPPLQFPKGKLFPPLPPLQKFPPKSKIKPLPPISKPGKLFPPKTKPLPPFYKFPPKSQIPLPPISKPGKLFPPKTKSLTLLHKLSPKLKIKPLPPISKPGKLFPPKIKPLPQRHKFPPKLKTKPLPPIFKSGKLFPPKTKPLPPLHKFPPKLKVKPLPPISKPTFPPTFKIKPLPPPLKFLPPPKSTFHPIPKIKPLPPLPKFLPEPKYKIKPLPLISKPTFPSTPKIKPLPPLPKLPPKLSFPPLSIPEYKPFTPFKLPTIP